MRRKICFFIVCSMMIILCGCSKKNKTTSKESVYEQGLHIISLMNEMIQNDAYIKMTGVSTNMQSTVEKVKEGDYSSPSNVYRVSVSIDIEDALSILADSEEGESQIKPSNLDTMSKDLKTYLNNRLQTSIPSQLNSRYGTMSLAVSSVYVVNKSFLSDELKEDTIYVYTYSKGYPIMVVFSAGENQIVTGTGTFFMSQEFEDTEDGVKEMFSQYPLYADCKVEKITQ